MRDRTLPVASIAASEVLAETQYHWAVGGGTCVGRKFPGIEWKVVQIMDGPIKELTEAVELPTGQIGELLVSGPVVTREYVTRVESNALGKVEDGARIWHRMGDAGYLDAQGRFWFCGRSSRAFERLPAPCTRCPARQSSISIPTCTVRLWWALVQ